MDQQETLLPLDRGHPQHGQFWTFNNINFPPALWVPSTLRSGESHQQANVLCNAGHPQRGYAVTNQANRSDLRQRRGMVFRKVIVCTRCTRNPHGVGGYESPPDTERQYVCIKVINLATINPTLLLERARNRPTDNPYRDIYYRSSYENSCFLPVIDVLELNNFLYVVSPEGIPLEEVIFVQRDNLQPHPQRPDSLQVRWIGNTIQILEPSLGISINMSTRVFYRAIAVQLFEMPVVLARHGICHRDVSPANLVLLPDPLRPDRFLLKLMDFGFALQIPINPTTGRRFLMLHQGNFGTQACMAPEVFLNSPFVPYDGLQADLWAVGIVMYMTWTAKLPYGRPTRNDANFLCFVCALHPEDERLRSEVIADARVRAALQDPSSLPSLYEPRTFELLAQQLRLHPTWSEVQASNWLEAYVLEGLDDREVRFLANLHRVNPKRRWSLSQARDEANMLYV